MNSIQVKIVQAENLV